jgi:hypothetical protein
MRNKHSGRTLARTLALLLVLAVVGVTSLAKVNRCLPHAKHAGRSHTAMKADVDHLEFDAIRAPLHTVSRIVPLRPRFTRAQLDNPQIPSAEEPGLTIVLQHRPPPVYLA